MTKNMDSRAVYLYCFTYADHLGAIKETGIGNTPLYLTSCQKVAAVLSDVCLDEFCGPEADNNLKLISWVGPRAALHEKVVESVMTKAPVFPARFGTIFRSMQSLQSLMQNHHRAIARFLDQVMNQSEWSVKGLMDTATLKTVLLSEKLAEAKQRLALLSPGKRYFHEKQMRNSVQRDMHQWLQQNLKEIAMDLNSLSHQFCERKPLSRNATGMDEDMVLNWAFLVAKDAIANFKARIEELKKEWQQYGLSLAISGPWPPYSFCPALEMESQQ